MDDFLFFIAINVGNTSERIKSKQDAAVEFLLLIHRIKFMHKTSFITVTIV